MGKIDQKIKSSLILKYLVIIFSLLAFQTLTYLTIGQSLLKNKLLPNYFTNLTHHSDSIFVRDFFVSECYVGDSKTYTSNNLSNDKDLIRTKFNVDYVFFDSMENFNWSDTTENSYNLSYNTWTARPD